MRTVESESRCLTDTFEDPRCLWARGAGLTARPIRGLLFLEGASVDTLLGHANEMVQTRLGASATGLDVGLDFAGSEVGLG